MHNFSIQSCWAWPAGADVARRRMVRAGQEGVMYGQQPDRWGGEKVVHKVSGSLAPVNCLLLLAV